MKIICLRGILSIFLVLQIASLYGQNTPGRQAMDPAKADSLRRNMPKIGKVSGSVRDGLSNQPVEFASVAVISLRDSIAVGGAMTDAKGNFSIRELPLGRYRIMISFIGYSTYNSEPFLLNPQNNMEFDAGVLKINPGSAYLKEVNIAAERPDLINTLDRKVYNLDKNIVNAGGSITEVMQNIPSINVDIDGNVSLRGSENVTILIDGKPSGMLGSDRKAVLQQIPASAVEQIEVITNPSARYDASGMAGIINIKTKKEKLRGMNGNAAVGLGSNDKYNFSVNGNNRTDKLNLYANYSFRHDTRSSTGEGNQQYYLPNQDPYSYLYNSHGRRKSENHTGKLGVDFYLNPTNTLGLSGGLSRRTENDPDQLQYRFLDKDGIQFQQFINNSYSEEENTGVDLSADYKRSWKDSKRELTASAAYTDNSKKDDNELQSTVYSFGETPYQLSLNTNNYQSLILQSDLIQPVNESGKIEAGVKSTLRQIDNDQEVFTYDAAISDYTTNTIRSDRFLYDEQVMAAYLMYSGKWKKLDYNAGLRAEQTLSEIDSKSLSEKFSNDYFSLFPSAFLKYTLAERSELQISYSRRVNRPETRALNPYIDYSDSLTLRSGNPFLKPEFIHSLELAHSRQVGPIDLTATVYYRHSDNLITRFRSVDRNTGVGNLTFVNFSTSENIGAELVMRYQHEKLGSAMLSFNGFQNKINAGNIEPELQSDSRQWSVRLNTTIKITKSTNLQLTGNYNAPRVTPVSRVRGFSGFDVGLKQDLWKGKGSLNLNISDVFLTRVFKVTNFSDFYELNVRRRRESRVAMLTLSYRFGKQDSSLFQRKKSQRGQQQNDSQMEMIDY